MKLCAKRRDQPLRLREGRTPAPGPDPKPAARYATSAPFRPYLPRPCRSNPPRNRVQIAKPESCVLELLQKLRNPVRRECLFDRRFQVAKLTLFFDFERSSVRKPPVTAPSLNNFQKRNAQTLERETGIEPATNSLEGCDSTTELLPPSTAIPCQRAALPAFFASHLNLWSR